MRAWILTVPLLLLAVPTLSSADIARDPPAKRTTKPKVTPKVATPTPTPDAVELDEATAAKRDELLEKAKHQSNMAEFLEARALYRQAIALDRTNADAKAGLASAEKECLTNAKRQISEAKAYEAAYNYPEALKALDLALKYADRESDKENQQAKEIIKRIKRNSER